MGGGVGGGGAITTITTTTPFSLTLDTKHSRVVATRIGKHVPLSESQGLETLQKRLGGPCRNALVLFRVILRNFLCNLLRQPVRNLAGQLGQQLARLRVVGPRLCSARRHSDGLHTLLHRHLCPHPWKRQTKLFMDALVTHVAPLDVSPVRQATHSMIIIGIIEVALREQPHDHREAFVDKLRRPTHPQTSARCGRFLIFPLLICSTQLELPALPCKTSFVRRHVPPWMLLEWAAT